MKKTLIGILSILIGMGVGVAATTKIMIKEVNLCQENLNKYLTLFQMMNQWVKVKQAGKELSKYFEDNNYSNIAIYGMGYVGETLVEELKNTNIRIEYGIDQNAINISMDLPVVTLEDKLREVDVIVVTAVTYFDTISYALQKKISCPIISLENILYEI